MASKAAKDAIFSCPGRIAKIIDSLWPHTQISVCIFTGNFSEVSIIHKPYDAQVTPPLSLTASSKHDTYWGHIKCGVVISTLMYLLFM